MKSKITEEKLEEALVVMNQSVDSVLLMLGLHLIATDVGELALAAESSAHRGRLEVSAASLIEAGHEFWSSFSSDYAQDKRVPGLWSMPAPDPRRSIPDLASLVSPLVERPPADPLCLLLAILLVRKHQVGETMISRRGL